MAFFRLYVDNRPVGKRSPTWIKCAELAISKGLAHRTEKGIKLTTAMDVSIREVNARGKEDPRQGE